MPPLADSTAEPPAYVAWLERLVKVRPGEVAALGWACLYHFSIFSAWYILRPLRDDMGVVGGTKNLHWLFTATAGAMLLANPLFGAVVARWPRRKFIPYVYRFFQANLLVFWLLLRFAPAEWQVALARVFYIWASVFNLFVISVFWGLMADLFTSAQGQRLFGMLALGGTLGAITGAAVTERLVHVPYIGATGLLLVSIALLEVSIACVARLARGSDRARGARPAAAAPAPRRAGVATGVWGTGRSAFAGILRTLCSPYLLGICGYMFLYTLTSTFLYFQQNALTSTIADRAARTAWFARVDLYVNLAALGLQFLVTGRVLSTFGVGPTAALVPLLTVGGFLVLAYSPTLTLMMWVQVVRRSAEYALGRPAREMFFTVVDRDEKYKAKNFIDTFVYRGGDTLGAWVHAKVAAVTGGAALLAYVGVPLAAGWAVAAVTLGRYQRRLAALPAAGPPQSAGTIARSAPGSTS